MSHSSSSVTKYIIVEASTSGGSFSGLTVCGGNGLTVDFITGCTSDGVNLEGGIFNNGVLTIPTINATTFSGGTYYGDGSNLIGISSVDSYMTGGTYTNGFITFSGNGVFSDVSIDVSALLDNTNYYVTGSTLNGNTLELGRNGGLSTLTTDLSSLTTVDNYVSGGTYNTGNIFFSGNSSETSFIVDVSALLDDTNSYVTGGTVSGTNLILGRNGGLSDITIDTSVYFDDVDNYVTGATMNINTLELSRSGGLSDVTVDLSQFIDNTNYYVTGSTLNGNVLELGRSGGLSTLTTDLSQFVDNTDNFITGGAMVGTSLVLNRTDVLSAVTVDLSQFIDLDTSVTGLTYNPATYDLTLSQDNGKPSYVSNLATLASDIFVLSGVYDVSTGVVTYTTNSGTTFNVSGFTSGMTDSYTISANLNNTTIEFENNILGPVTYGVDLGPLFTGKTNNTDFWVHTGDTNNPHQTTFSNLINTGHTHTLSEITDFSSYSGSVQTQIGGKVDNTTFTTYTADTLTTLNTKVDNGINVGDGHEIFSGITGTDIYFRTLSGGTNTTLTTINDVIKIDVTIPEDVNTFVTGSTLNGNTLELGRNGGLPTLTTDLSQFLDNTDRFVTGATMNVNVLELTRSGGLSDVTVDLSQFLDNTNTFVSGGTYNTGNLFFSGNSSETSFIVDVSALLDDTNSYVTGGTVSGTDLVLGRNGGLVDVTIDTSAYFDNTDNFVTGATMNVNTLELSRSGGLSDVTVDLSQFIDDTNDGVVSGASMNGNTLELGRTQGLSDVTVDLSQFIDNTNFYVTGSTFSDSTLTLGRNGGLSGITTELIGLNVVHNCLKDSAGTLNVGDPVFAKSWNDTFDVVSVELADATTSSGTMPAIGVIIHTGNTTVQATLLVSGQHDNFDTSSWAIRDPLYVSSISTLTNIRPTGDTQVQKIGQVLKVDATVGIITVHGANRANDIPNLSYSKFWLGGTDDVGVETTINDLTKVTTPNPTDNLMFWDQTDSIHKKVDWSGVSVTTVANIGGGIGTFAQKVGTENQLKTLTSTGSTVVITTNGTEVNIENAAGGGESNTASSVGFGQSLWKDKVASDLRFYSISGGTNVTVDLNGDTIVVNGPAGAGQDNTASNLDTTGFYAQKVSDDLQFKGLTSTGGTITISNNATTVNVESSGGNTVNDATKIFSWYMNIT